MIPEVRACTTRSGAPARSGIPENAGALGWEESCRRLESFRQTVAARGRGHGEHRAAVHVRDLDRSRRERDGVRVPVDGAGRVGRAVARRGAVSSDPGPSGTAPVHLVRRVGRMVNRRSVALERGVRRADARVPRTLRGLPAERLDAPRLRRGVERPTGGQADPSSRPAWWAWSRGITTRRRAISSPRTRAPVFSGTPDRALAPVGALRY